MSQDFERHLLVDGSNIMHAWPDLRTLLKRDRDAARSRLSAALSVLHDAEHLRVSLVFDGRGPEMLVERPSGHVTFSHVYTPAGTTADQVIEGIVGRSGRPGACVVATDDRAERNAVEALGGSAVSSEDLASWVSRAGGRQRARVEERRRDNEAAWSRPRP